MNSDMSRTSGRLVASPSLEACKNRPKHYMDKRTGHYYFFSAKSHYGPLKVGHHAINWQIGVRSWIHICIRLFSCTVSCHRTWKCSH